MALEAVLGCHPLAAGSPVMPCSTMGRSSRGGGRAGGGGANLMLSLATYKGFVLPARNAALEDQWSQQMSSMALRSKSAVHTSGTTCAEGGPRAHQCLDPVMASSSLPWPRRSTSCGSAASQMLAVEDGARPQPQLIEGGGENTLPGTASSGWSCAMLDFLAAATHPDPALRPSAVELLCHPWLLERGGPVCAAGPCGSSGYNPAELELVGSHERSRAVVHSEASMPATLAQKERELSFALSLLEGC
jgi:serine/threonine protein kinase